MEFQFSKMQRTIIRKYMLSSKEFRTTRTYTCIHNIHKRGGLRKYTVCYIMQSLNQIYLMNWNLL